MPFHSRLRVRHGTDRQTDDGHQCIMPTLWGRGITSCDEAATICAPLLHVTWTATQGGMVTFTFHLLTLKVVRNVSRCTDNLHANFVAPATWLCRVMGKHATNWTWNWRRGVITLTFDLWGRRACRWCGSSYSVCIGLPTFDLLTLELVRNVSHDTDNLPANFGVSVTFRCPIRANMHQTDDMTLLPWPFNFDTTMHVSDAVIVIHPRTKFEVGRSPLLKIWCIFRLSINRSGYLDLWPFDTWTLSQVTRVMGFLPTNFQLATPFHSQLIRVRHGTHRETTAINA